MHWCLPYKGNILDETNGVYAWSTNSIEEERRVHEGLGRRVTFYTRL
jgi:hypothetical protein